MKFHFHNPQKAVPCAEPRHLTIYALKSTLASGMLAIGRTKKVVGLNIRGLDKRSEHGVYISPKLIWGEEALLTD